jgi:hypothetical protein
VAEVVGAAAGQPEQKLYKAIGQMVRTVSNLAPDWNLNTRFVIAVHGNEIASQLQGVKALAKLEISGVVIKDDARDDCWPFGEPLHAE